MAGRGDPYLSCEHDVYGDCVECLKERLAAAEKRADLAEREVERLRKHVCADGHHPTFLRGTCIRCGVGAKETP
jgi:hypothetical protein